MEFGEKKLHGAAHEREEPGGPRASRAVAADCQRVVSLRVGKPTDDRTLGWVQVTKAHLRPGHLPAMFSEALTRSRGVRGFGCRCRPKVEGVVREVTGVRGWAMAQSQE